MDDMTPTPEDLARDLRADLEVCEKATPGPWEIALTGTDPQEPRAVVRPRPDLEQQYPATKYGAVFREDRIVHAWSASSENLRFIATARAALPAAIRIALAERAENARLRQENACLQAALRQMEFTRTFPAADASTGDVRGMVIRENGNG